MAKYLKVPLPCHLMAYGLLFCFTTFEDNGSSWVPVHDRICLRNYSDDFAIKSVGILLLVLNIWVEAKFQSSKTMEHHRG